MKGNTATRETVKEIIRQVAQVLSEHSSVGESFRSVLPSTESLSKENEEIATMASAYSAALKRIDNSAENLAGSTTAKAFAQGVLPIVTEAISKPHLKDRLTITPALLLSTVKAIAEGE